MKLVKNILLLVLGLGIVSMLATSLRSQHTSAKDDSAIKNFRARLKDGVGTEVKFASPAASTAASPAAATYDVSSSVESVSSFISNRSGLTLDNGVKSQLLALEQAAVNNKGNTVSLAQLSEILTEVGLHRVANLSDHEISQAIESLHGFNSPSLPTAIRQSQVGMIPIRMGVLIKMADSEATAQLKAMRSPAAQRVTKGQIMQEIKQALEERVRNLSAGVPEQFGQNWDVVKNLPAKNLTPLQSFLLAYSLVSDDKLADSFANLQNRMWQSHDQLVKVTGSYPEPVGQFAFGQNGYIYSSPIEIIFNTDTQLELLKNFERKGN